MKKRIQDLKKLSERNAKYFLMIVITINEVVNSVTTLENMWCFDLEKGSLRRTLSVTFGVQGSLGAL